MQVCKFGRWVASAQGVYLGFVFGLVPINGNNIELDATASLLEVDLCSRKEERIAFDTSP